RHPLIISATSEIYTLSLHDALPISPSTFRISGRVMDAITGQPLARASVALNPSNPLNNPNSPDSGRVEVTDAEGVFAFAGVPPGDRKSTRLNSSHLGISYAVFCLKK